MNELLHNNDMSSSFLVSLIKQISKSFIICMNNILFSFPSLPVKLILIFFFIILSNNKILSLFFVPLAYPISFPYYSYYKRKLKCNKYTLSVNCKRGLLNTKKFFAMHNKVIYRYLHICV